MRFEALSELRFPSSNFRRYGIDQYLERGVIAHASLPEAISSVLGAKLAKNEFHNFVDYEAMVRSMTCDSQEVPYNPHSFTQ